MGNNRVFRTNCLQKECCTAEIGSGCWSLVVLGLGRRHKAWEHEQYEQLLSMRRPSISLQIENMTWLELGSHDQKGISSLKGFEAGNTRERGDGWSGSYSVKVEEPILSGSMSFFLLLTCWSHTQNMDYILGLLIIFWHSASLARCSSIVFWNWNLGSKLLSCTHFMYWNILRTIWHGIMVPAEFVQ